MSQTTTVSMRLSKRELQQIDATAKALHIERSTLLKMALRTGCRDLLMEKTSAAYRKGELTLSRAAELNQISIHEMIARMDSLQLELNYGPEELQMDLSS